MARRQLAKMVVKYRYYYCYVYFCMLRLVLKKSIRSGILSWYSLCIISLQYKTAVDPDRFSIFKLIQELGYSPSILHQVVTLNLDMSSNKCDFILGHDSHSRPVVKHADENSSLQKGDHIIEINGASVTHFNESELSKQLLQAASNLCIVVLRKTTNCELKIQEKTEEAESIREDLSLTMIELESVQDENRDIKSELERSVNRRFLGFLSQFTYVESSCRVSQSKK